MSARIGTSACQPQVSPLKNTNWMDSIENIITFQTEKNQFILSVMFIFWISTHRNYIYIHSIYNLFIPSAPFGHQQKNFSCSALEEAKSAQISERIALLALADADHLQKSFSSAGAGITSCYVHTSLLPHCPILHSWHPMLRDTLSTVCNSPWARACFQASE